MKLRELLEKNNVTRSSFFLYIYKMINYIIWKQKDLKLTIHTITNTPDANLIECLCKTLSLHTAVYQKKKSAYSYNSYLTNTPDANLIECLCKT